MPLREYRRKRDFAQTGEPAAGGKRGHIFVVQLHHASHRHFDFRLELDGVLKSWAVPKGPSFDPAVKRLAMEVEDHPVSYAGFEGDIPAGNYGAGHVDIFDSGTWEPVGNAREGLAKGDLKFVLHGDVLRGSWVLVRTRPQGKRQQWLLIKHADGYANARDANAFVDPKTDRPISRAARRKVWPAAMESQPAVPKRAAHLRSSAALGRTQAETIDGDAFAPQLCRSQKAPPAGDEWLHETKWDGYRILATVVRGKARLWSRNAIEWTQRLPELAAAIESLRLKSAQLDGEMIVLRGGQSDFNALQGRLSAENRDPAVYMLFDMPHLNGQPLRDLPLVERKAKLKEILDRHPHDLLRYSEHVLGHGAEIFSQVTKAGLEGIVSKRADSRYSGTRNGDWLKIKGRPSDEFVVIGFTEPKGSRSGIGALLLAQPKNGKLVYVGRVGTGIGSLQLRALRKQLERRTVAQPAADIALMSRKDQRLALWVKPELVIEAFHQGIGGLGLLRQAAFKTLREDKTPADLEESMPRKSAKTAGTKRTAAAKKPAGKPARKSAGGADEVRITHPERVVYPQTGATKGDVVAYYRAVAPWMVTQIGARPLSIMRCPDGSAKTCFFQKHLRNNMGADVHGIPIVDSAGEQRYLCIADAAGLLELVQMNVLEFHPWGAKSKDPERADRIVFDLDPHPTVAWPRVIAAARELNRQLKSIGIHAFLRTSGGKGLHVVVPLKPAVAWDDAKAFAKAFAEAMTAMHPSEFVATAGEKNRKGKIFIDWLRNYRGSTSVASYSLRARPDAGVAMPLAWTQLSKLQSATQFTLANAAEYVRRRRADPWADIDKIRQSLPKP
jgi:bifunctional non-homologous end joining protein LigD